MNISPNVRHLPMLASVIGRKMGVKVVFANGMETAATDGKTIYVPEITAAGTEADVNLLVGLIDHEAAHIRFTDFSVGKGDSSLVKSMANILEDIRIERLLAKEYRGVTSNLNAALQILIERGSFPIDGPSDDTPVISLLVSNLLFGLRSTELNQSILDEVGEKYRKALEAKIGPSLSMAIWQEALNGCWAGSTAEVHKSAAAIETMIKEAAKEPEPEDNPEESGESESQEEAADQSAQGESSQDDQGGNPGKGEKESQDGGGKDQQSAGDPQGAGNDQGAGQQAAKDPSKSEIAKVAQAMLDQMNDKAIAEAIESRSELSNAMKDALPCGGSKTFQGEATDVEAKGGGFSRGRSVMIGKVWDQAELSKLASSMVFGLDRRLETLLEAKADNFRETTRSGMVNGRRLAKIIVGNPNIFYRDHETEALNTAVMVVSDLSGSMKTEDVSHEGSTISREAAAAAATYALSKSMGRLDIPYGVIQFTDGKQLIGRIGSNTSAIKGLLRGASGGTNTPSALRGAADLMAERHEDRKLIILIIDGDDDVVEMEAVLAETLRRGIQVAGVFIGNNGKGMRDMFGSDMVQVTNSKDIAKALFSALENVAK